MSCEPPELTLIRNMMINHWILVSLNVDTKTASFLKSGWNLLQRCTCRSYQDRLPAMQLPSPMMDLKTGAMQSLRLTTLMTSLQAVVLRKISSLDGKKISPGVIPNSVWVTMQAKKICMRVFFQTLRRADCAHCLQ